MNLPRLTAEVAVYRTCEAYRTDPCAEWDSGASVAPAAAAERIAGLEADIDLVTGRLLEPGRKIAHCRETPLAAQHGNLRRASRRGKAKCAGECRNRNSCPDPARVPHGNLPVVQPLRVSIHDPIRPCQSISSRMIR